MPQVVRNPASAVALSIRQRENGIDPRTRIRGCSSDAAD
jgi:hypothetical protein